MKAVELRDKDYSQLQQELMSLREQQFKLRMQKMSGQTVKPHLFNIVRKDIARIKTIMAEKDRNR